MTGFVFAFLAAAAAGVLSGFGVGGGTLLLIYLTAVLGMDQHLAQGINLLYFLPAAAAALPGHLKNGYVERKAVLPAVCAGLLTTGLAAYVSTGLPMELLRRCFGIFMLGIGLSELVKSRRR